MTDNPNDRETNGADAIGALLTTAKDRVSSPIIGPFVIAWLLWNWQFVFVLVSSDLPSPERILLATTRYGSVSSWLLLPILSTAVYIIVVPWLNRLPIICEEFAADRWAAFKGGVIQRLWLNRKAYWLRTLPVDQQQWHAALQELEDKLLVVQSSLDSRKVAQQKREKDVDLREFAVRQREKAISQNEETVLRSVISECHAYLNKIQPHNSPAHSEIFRILTSQEHFFRLMDEWKRLHSS